ncbi:E3 SUMO-protein ligase ZBED1-like [Ruditapes philippinarum]|uniref:E3 SUMO-protein ligase ZBED1-like n=1 Tax=Ruditapes philippinarum TaxID=129788 RepID=UPI00295BDB18|nr:E3 SUMO-protein ligase ZBED1-like [Ruditapes philippinarum]
MYENGFMVSLKYTTLQYFRYNELTEYLQETSLLDPRFKVSYLNDEDAVAVSGRVVIEAASKCVSIKSEPVEQSNKQEPHPAEPTLPGPSQIEKDDHVKTEVTTTCTSQSSSSDLASILDDVIIVKAVKGEKSLVDQVKEEIDKYMGIDLLDLNSDPLSWWKNNKWFFPHLAALAQKRLCVPATSVPSERVFSTAGDILSAQRAALSAENVDMLIFLKKNMP